MISRLGGVVVVPFLDGDGHSRWEVDGFAFVVTQTTTAAEFCLFLLCRAATKPKTIVIFGTCMSTTLLLAIHNDIIPKTNGTDAGGASSWQHFAGMQKSDCIRINSTFFVGWMNRNTDSHGLLFVVPFG